MNQDDDLSDSDCLIARYELEAYEYCERNGIQVEPGKLPTFALLAVGMPPSLMHRRRYIAGEVRHRSKGGACIGPRRRRGRPPKHNNSSSDTDAA